MEDDRDPFEEFAGAGFSDDFRDYLADLDAFIYPENATSPFDLNLFDTHELLKLLRQRVEIAGLELEKLLEKHRTSKSNDEYEDIFHELISSSASQSLMLTALHISTIEGTLKKFASAKGIKVDRIKGDKINNYISALALSENQDWETVNLYITFLKKYRNSILHNSLNLPSDEIEKTFQNARSIDNDFHKGYFDAFRRSNRKSINITFIAIQKPFWIDLQRYMKIFFEELGKSLADIPESSPNR
ncbi:hypothetical protein [Oceanicella sp. SM1341]|uniref:hypothetical protein n=1 Tax=Oceanicella sp. SM1341 TaxID=1548889 RepID=UPI0013008BB0|nr:hypothetical protein [Oceanicella sp. SM1341]